MPGIAMDEVREERAANKHYGTLVPMEDPYGNRSPKSGLSLQSPGSVHVDFPVDGLVDTSIEKLYENVCDMQSSDQSPSRRSFGSDGEESRIDSELNHLVGGEMREVEIIREEEDIVEKPENTFPSDSVKDSPSVDKKEKTENTQSGSSKRLSLGKKASHLQLDHEASPKSSPRGKGLSDRPPIGRKNEKSTKKLSPVASHTKKQKDSPLKGSKLPNGTEDLNESMMDNPDLGPFLLNQARNLVSSGENLQKALLLGLRAAKSFEMSANGKPNLEFVMCLHVTAAIYCSLGQYSEAIPLLEHSIEIPAIEEGHEHALAKFAGHMQLGDTYAMLGQLENSLVCYTTGLEVQKQVLGEADLRVGETYRYLAEAHVQALQFDEAEKFCQLALDIHKKNIGPASLEEAADRRLMGLICETKGNHEAALEHLVLAGMSMVANGQEMDVAAVDCSIGDSYLSLSRYDEAVFAYQKALTVFKTTKGENHPAVGSVYIRLADLYNKTGKMRESLSYCENALRIYEKPVPGIPPEEIACGLTDIAAIYESMNEVEQAIKLLQKALKIYNDAPGQQNTIAGIEAQMGVLYYMLGNYSESYDTFKIAIPKLRNSGEKKSAFFGIALNQMGLACVQKYAINEAVELFEEAKTILEQECGPYHPDTLGVYSNLAGTYDAIGR